MTDEIPPKKPRRVPPSWPAVIGALLALALLELLFGVFSAAGRFIHAQWSQYYFPTARERWDSLQITDYSVEVRGAFPLNCVNTSLGGAASRLVVKNGVVVSTPEGYDPQNCPFAGKTIPEIFDWVEKHLSNKTIVDFDPQYGFVSRFELNNCGGSGLLSPMIFDCGGGFEFRNFQPAEK